MYTISNIRATTKVTVRVHWHYAQRNADIAFIATTMRWNYTNISNAIDNKRSKWINLPCKQEFLLRYACSILPDHSFIARRIMRFFLELSPSRQHSAAADYNRETLHHHNPQSDQRQSRIGTPASGSSWGCCYCKQKKTLASEQAQHRGGIYVSPKYVTLCSHKMSHRACTRAPSPLDVN